MAVMTITTTAAQDARIIAAFGAKWNLGRNATGPEVKADIIDYLRQTVLRIERDAAIAAASNTAAAGIATLDPT